jgi:DNA-binding transcriptional MerR regulator
MTDEMRLDDLARTAGVASTTVRLYQSKGLLAAPRLQGRTGWYDDSHLRRLRLIARLQDDGFSLAGIASLLDAWESGGGIDALVGVETQLDELLGEPHAVTVDVADLLDRFPEGSMTPELVQRAGALGLVELLDDGTFRVGDRRFLETGAALARLGVPIDVILDEWDALTVHTDAIAGRFIDVFEHHLAPADWKDGLSAERAHELTQTLAQLQVLARHVLAAALDRSLATLGRQRLSDLLPSDTAGDMPEGRTT